MVCSDFNLIFPKSSRWKTWDLFEKKILAADTLLPYMEVETRENKDLYLVSMKSPTLYAKLLQNENSIESIESDDDYIFSSIIIREQRRRISPSLSESTINEWFQREEKEAWESLVWTEVMKDDSDYDEFEGMVYTHTKHLIYGYYNKSFMNSALQLQNPSAAALNNCALDYLMSGNPSYAEKILQEALKLDFELSCTWHTLSMVYNQLDMPKKCKWAHNEYKQLLKKS